MSRLTNARAGQGFSPDFLDIGSKQVKNFMGGTSYTLSPLESFKLIAASSIFGEKMFYKPSDFNRKAVAQPTQNDGGCGGRPADGVSSEDDFVVALRDSLSYDFGGTLILLVELRQKYNMRLNPNVALVEAASHANRAKFNAENPTVFRNLARGIIQIPSDIKSQLDYWFYRNGSKNKLPNILKKVWATELNDMSMYHIGKYQSKGLRDLVRISHAKGENINTLMKTQGSISMEENNTTWERLKSAGKTWVEILDTIKVPHMALLRNLRGIFDENVTLEVAERVLESLEKGVPYGRQFPFRYYTAFQVIVSQYHYSHKDLILASLERCISIAMKSQNFPKLSGSTVCLSDNSGSAHGTFTSEFGSVKVSDINNLSSAMTAVNSDRGEVVVFGDKMTRIPAPSDGSILTVHEAINNMGRGVGMGTENGIWMFFAEAIAKKLHYDNIFIYSDQQAGHGGLYGINASDYSNYQYSKNGRNSAYIDVMKLVDEYRRIVNPKANVFSVQTAGYTNTVTPQQMYRGAILTGWTGKETLFAKTLIDTWDKIESSEANIQTIAS